MQADEPEEQGPDESAQPPDDEAAPRFDFQPEEGQMLFHNEWQAAHAVEEEAAPVDDALAAHVVHPMHSDDPGPYAIDCRGS